MKTEYNKDILNINNEPFYSEYIGVLINRVTHSNMSLELDLGDPDNSVNAVRFKDNMIAFKRLINYLEYNVELSENMIINTADLVNDSSMYVSRGYRNIGDTLADTTIKISDPKNIPNDMNKLIDNYNTAWKEYDPFLREALFHITFIRIHPFEDGNGRTGRLIMNYNLLKQGISPVILTTDLNEYYHQYIKDCDYESLAKLLKIQSVRENKAIEELYESFLSQNNNQIINK